MRTRLSLAAAQDLAEIVRTLRSDSPQAALRFRDRFVAVRQFVGEYPNAGRQTDEAGVRYVNTIPFPFLVFYETVKGQPVILRIMHGARDPKTMPARPRGP